MEDSFTRSGSAALLSSVKETEWEWVVKVIKECEGDHTIEWSWLWLQRVVVIHFIGSTAKDISQPYLYSRTSL